MNNQTRGRLAGVVSKPQPRHMTAIGVFTLIANHQIAASLVLVATLLGSCAVTILALGV